MHRSPSPYRAHSPYGGAPPPVHGQQPLSNQPMNLPTGPTDTKPGSIAYSTTTGPDGRLIYQPFRAVAASYQTPSGVVSGIQWIPADPATVPPPGTQIDPSNWHGSSHSQTSHDWQRADEKRRKQEEKEAKRYRDDGRHDPDYELRLARERDAQSTASRDRRKSFNSGTAAPPSSLFFPSHATGATGYPSQSGGPQVTGYPSNPYFNGTTLDPPPSYATGPPVHSRTPSSGSYHDITRQFNDMNLNRSKDYPERDRKTSGPSRSSKYNVGEGASERQRTVSGNYADRGNPYPPGPGPYLPYHNSNPQLSGVNPYPTSQYRDPSPNMHPSEIPFGTAGSSGYPTAYSSSSYGTSPSRKPAEIGRSSSTTPFGGPVPHVYPRGHILEGQPIPTGSSRPPSRPASRAPSPNPGMFSHNNSSPYPVGKSPHMPVATIPGEPRQLPAPEAFSRPINAANSFQPFNMDKVQDMDEIYERAPKMPKVLTTHDIYADDWNRCMQDLGRSWIGQLPVPSTGRDGQPPRRSTLAADLVELWNTSFFHPRGVELILYKGNERRTGPQAGQIEHRLPRYEEDSSPSHSSDSGFSDHDGRGGPYGRSGYEQGEARRRHQEDKQERRRRRREKRARKKAKTYSLYISCLSKGAPGAYVGGPSAMSMPGGYGVAASAPGGYGSPMYRVPEGIPTARSHGSTSSTHVGYTSPPYGTSNGIATSRSHGYGGGY
ncbi:hypothetical protein M413DRAFT_295866 [Hebeloma cylindrosporum]|uniref:Uncharacterized protein n=1 Tax=Hebeloma cylindrosporum TaxID=76867 RepID=A0A0C2Y7M6_HEBCY|nr:hypothetical protein M413DRAFT_295866 [Hebeloma cylindrosporum h7]